MSTLFLNGDGQFLGGVITRSVWQRQRLQSAHANSEPTKKLMGSAVLERFSRGRQSASLPGIWAGDVADAREEGDSLRLQHRIKVAGLRAAECIAGGPTLLAGLRGGLGWRNISRPRLT